MLSYLQKFNNLPKNIKAAVASPEAAARIIEIGKKYNFDLASLVMKVMVKDIPLDGLSAYLVNQNNLGMDQARLLEKDLRKYIFNNVIDYLLGASAGPKLVFSEADEKEVKTMAEPIETGDFDMKIEEAITRIFEKSRISIADPVVKGKFRQVIKTYLRLTRDKASTMETLTKASELGGVSLSRDAAERAMSWADTELKELKKVTTPQSGKIPVPEDKLPKEIIAPASPFVRVPSPAEYNLEASLKEQGKLKTVETPKIIEADHEIAPPVPAIVDKTKPETTTPAAKKIIKEALKSDKPLDKPALRRLAGETKAPEPIVNLKISSSGKIKMDDVRFTPQVLSPVDELRYMSLKNFRRLSSDPVKATEKIKEKLETLGQEDYAKKIQGIVAWQESPLNNLYLNVCRQALEEGKPVTEVLQAELKKEPTFLKPTELSAIIALNHLLKF